MAVESRFVVIRHGVEAKTFMDKKSADEYDKMLDMADNLAEVFSQSPITLTDSLSEELSIYLAQNRDDVLVALLAKKAASKPTASKTKAKSAPQLVQVADSKASSESAEQAKRTLDADQSKAAKTAKPKAKATKTKSAKQDDALSEAG